MRDSPEIAAEIAPLPALWTRRTLAAVVALGVLVGLGDAMVIGLRPGIGLAVFFAALIVVMLALRPEMLRQRRVQVLAALAIVAALPLGEAATPAGVACALGGASLLALATGGLLPARFEGLTGVTVRFGALAPFRLAGDALRLMVEAGSQRLGGRLLKAGLMWLVPVGLAVVFVGLFAAANPMIETVVDGIRLDALLVDPGRVIAWGLIAVVAWPLLMPRLLALGPQLEMQGPVRPRPESLVFGRGAVLRSLVVFNVLFAVQTVTDLLYLSGGVRLPEGMSLADYAHRGAYPLVATALLAAGFVLVAMRPGGLGETSPPIRRLVYVFIAQNVWLVVSSILRLDLYVEAYALTQLRFAAGVWMGLVAVGLGLILVRIALRRSNQWLLSANLVALGVTLYGLAWFDMEDFIARFNVAHSYEMSGQGIQLDISYMSDVGAAAIPAIDAFIAAKGPEPVWFPDFRLLRNDLAEGLKGPIDWRSWTWREARLRDYVAAHPFAPGS